MSRASKERLTIVVVVIGFIAFAIGLVWFVAVDSRNHAIETCENLAEQSGRPAKYESGVCWIQITPDLWVRSYDLPRYLDHLEYVGEGQ